MQVAVNGNNKMKLTITKIFILLFVLTSCQTKPKENKTNELQPQNSSIILNKELVDSLYLSERLRPDNPDFKYYKVKDFLFDLNENQKADSIILYRLVGWENDPGDFQQIKIKMDNGFEWNETNFNGWVRFDHNYRVPNSVKEKNQIDTDLLLCTDFGETKILGLFGWAYASQPGLLTIIEFSTNKPRVMLNKNWEILEIDSSTMKAENYKSKFQIELINSKLEIKKE